MFKSYMKLTLAFAAFALLFTNGASAQCADGELAVDWSVGGGTYDGEISWILNDSDGNTVGTGGAPESGTWCLAPGDYTFIGSDSWGDGWNGASADFSIDGNSIGSLAVAGSSDQIILSVSNDVPGCTEETASNYNSAANVDDGSCCFSDFVTVVLYDSWGDGWSGFGAPETGGGLTIFGTFYEFATGSSMSMDFCLDAGCYSGEISMDNYPSEASWDVFVNGELLTSGGAAGFFFSTDPTCVVYGCDDEFSCNYDPAVNVNDGSCDYETCAGCTDPGACNYISVATLDNGSCDYSCVGCTDATATNYDAAYTIACEDCCSYCEGAFAGTINVGGGSWQSEVSWTLTQGDVEVAAGVAGATNVCLEAGCYTFNMFDSWGDGWNGNTYSFDGFDGVVAYDGGLLTGATGSDDLDFNGGACTYGCTDAAACNYDMDAPADYDDGSCDYSCIGCMNVTAANYDPNATIEGECVFCDPGTFVLSIDMADSFGDGWGGAMYYIYEADGDGSLVTSGSIETANSGDGLSEGLDMICLAPGCYNVDVTGGTDAGEVSVTLSDQFGTQYGSVSGNESWPLNFLLTGSCGFEGCTSATALNYNVSATIDDGSCQEPPANDLFDNAEAVYCDAFVSGTVEYATDDMSLIGTQFGNNDIDTEGVWFVYNADADQQVIVSTCDTPANDGDTDYLLDTKIHVYAMGIDGLEGIADNDDGCESGTLSTAAFNVTTGSDYYIYVSKYGAFTPGNDFVLSVSCAACDVPSNDDCDGAIAQVNGVTFTGSTCCASAEAMDIVWAGFGSSYGVWFTFNSANYDTFDFTAENLSNDVLGFVMMAGDDCASLNTVVGCQFTGTCAGSVEDFTTLEPNTDYYFLIYTNDAATCGDFEFTTTGVILGCTDAQATNYNVEATQDNGTCEYEGVVPANDLCDNAITLECNTVTIGSTGGSTNTGSPLGVAGCETAPGAGVWYTFVGNGQLHSLSTCGSAIDSKINIYTAETACGGGGIDTPPADACGEGLVTVNYSIGGGGFDSEVSWAIVDAAGTEAAAGTAGVGSVCVAEGEYTLEMYDTWGDGWNGATASLTNGLGETMGFFGLETGSFGEGAFSVAAYSTEPSYQAGEFTCFEAATGSDGTGACSLFDSDDVNFEFVSEVGVLYYVLVSTQGTDGSFDLELNCADVVLGCMNEAACNYNADANVDNSSCDFWSCVCADETGTAVMINMADSFGDGWNGNTYVITDLDGNEVASGTLDEAQFFIDANNFAGPESGFDTVCLAPGCYNITVDGGSWQSEVSWDISLEDGTVLASGGAGPTSTQTISVGGAVCGCTEAGACNYDPAATDDDGSCEYESCAGCTDMAACNYSEEALVDDGTCCYSNCLAVQMFDSWGDGWNGGSYTLSSVDGTVIGTGTIETGTNAEDTYCLADGCYVIDVVGASFAYEMSWTLVGAFGGLVTGLADESVTFNVGSGDQCVVGCAIACACNYDANANIAENDLCVFDGCSGCTYPDADNYDVTALSDDGTCEFVVANPCPADLNLDGSITTGDLLIFLGAFGTNCD